MENAEKILQLETLEIERNSLSKRIKDLQSQSKIKQQTENSGNKLNAKDATNGDDDKENSLDTINSMNTADGDGDTVMDDSDMNINSSDSFEQINGSTSSQNNNKKKSQKSTHTKIKK